MTEAAQAPETAPGIAHVGTDGRRISARGREAQLAALARGRQTVVAALTAQRDAGSEEALRVEIRQMALAGVRKALPNMIRIASGADKKAPKSAQVAATNLLTQLGQVELEARARGAVGPLSEMPLSELEQALRSSLDRVHELQAIPAQSEHIEDTEDSVPDIGTAQAESEADAPQAPPPGP